MNLFVEILSFHQEEKHQFDLVYVTCTECEMKQNFVFYLKKKIQNILQQLLALKKKIPKFSSPQNTPF